MAINGEMNMVGQRNVNALMQFLAKHRFRIADNLVRALDIFDRNIGQKRFQFLGYFLAFQREYFFDQTFVNRFTCMLFERNSTSHDNKLVACGIDHGNYVVVQHLLDFHFFTSPCTVKVVKGKTPAGQ
ncbi:hypothetical protein D1872_230400 [compost metagenome]